MLEQAAVGALRKRLEEHLPQDRFLDRVPDAESRTHDLSAYSLGDALAWVRPRTEDEVVGVVECAREAGAFVVPVGRRSAYWRPLDLAGAIAVDVSGLDAIGDVDVERGVVVCGAGATVGAIDDALRRHGSYLSIYPDAFGETSVGSMVSLGFSAGVGMANGTLADLVLGLRVVTGDGEGAVSIGAGGALTGTPFVREGLADPAGLWFGADGALGLITSVALRVRERPRMAQLSWHAEAGEKTMRDALAFARRVRKPGVFDTFRVVDAVDRTRGVRFDAVVQSPLGESELDARVEWLSGEVKRFFGDVAVTVERETGPDSKVSLRTRRSGALWRHWGRSHTTGVDVIVANPDAPAVLAETYEFVDIARARNAESIRVGLYFSPDWVNVGLHVDFPMDDAPARGHDFVREAMERLSRHRVVPYRWGRLWSAVMRDRLDGAHSALMRRLKTAVDPSGVFHPGASVFP